MSDIGPNSNRRQVARAVSALQDNVGQTGTIAADFATAQSDIATAQTNISNIRSDAGMVAGPVALTDDKLLTKQISRKVLALAAGPNASTVTVAHGVVPVLVTRCDIVLGDGSGNRLCFGQGGMLSDTIAHSIIVTIDGTNISLTSGAGGDYSGYAGSIILEYTLA